MNYDQEKLVWQFFADELSKVAMPQSMGVQSSAGKPKGMSPAALQKSIMKSRVNNIGFQRTSAAVVAPPPPSTTNNQPTIYMGGTP